MRPLLSSKYDEKTIIATLRTFLLALFLIGLVGAGTELILLEHTEDPWQWVPLVLIGISLIVLGWYGAARSPLSLHAFQGTMILFIIGGCLGLWLHYQGNVEFEREMYPSLKGFELFWHAVKGATPALAPGTLIQLGLLGLIYTYRHPALTATTKSKPH